MLLVSLSHKLVWYEWDGIYIVYQPSSAETHVFNETTASILKCLEEKSLSLEATKLQIEAALHMGAGSLDADDFAFATMRLEELGLLDRLDSTSAIQ